MLPPVSLKDTAKAGPCGPMRTRVSAGPKKRLLRSDIREVFPNIRTHSDHLYTAENHIRGVKCKVLT